MKKIEMYILKMVERKTSKMSRCQKRRLVKRIKAFGNICKVLGVIAIILSFAELKDGYPMAMQFAFMGIMALTGASLIKIDNLING